MSLLSHRIYMTLIVPATLIAVMTFLWTLTGHCCGIPFVTSEWDDCLPVSDTMVPMKYLASGHCDEKTWKRVP